MTIDDVRASAIALLNAGACNTPAFERLADEYGRLKARGSGEGVTEPKNKRRPPMAKKVVAKTAIKGVNGKEVRRSGFGRGAASNWDAFGTVVKTKGLRLEDGVYQVKGGELRRMADTNGTGTVCVVYRVAAKGKVEEKPAKAIKKAVAKKPEPKAAQKPVAKKAEAKKTAAKKEKKAEAKKGNAKKGK